MNTKTNKKTEEHWFEKKVQEELENRIQVLALRLKRLGFQMRREGNALLVERESRSHTATFNKERIEEAVVIGGEEVRLDRERVLNGHVRYITNKLSAAKGASKAVEADERQVQTREAALEKAVREAGEESSENELSL